MKLQLSQGSLVDKDGKTIGSALIFRPDVDIEERCFFEYTGDNHYIICIEVGSDGFPVCCKKVYKNSDECGEHKPASDDEILEMFKLCYGLLSKKRDEDKMTELGKDILDDMLPSGEK